MVTQNDVNEVYVTGMSWNTALGNNLLEVWDKLLCGKSGFKIKSSPFDLRNELIAPITPLTNQNYKEKFVDLTITTLLDAFNHAKLDISKYTGNIKFVIGTNYGHNLDTEFIYLDDWTIEIRDKINLFNNPILVSTACSSGTDSVFLGAELIRCGFSDICVCGATDIVTTAKRLGHTTLGTMSRSILKAFDQEHEGTLLGDGSAFIILESKQSAINRNANIYAKYRGSGMSNDAFSMTTPDMHGTSIKLAISRALTVAGLNTDDICVINAHGSGTKISDTVEKNSLNSIFGECENKPVVFATKGAFGHTLGATGIIETIALILALRNGIVPPIVGLNRPLSDFKLPLPQNTYTKISGRIGINITLGFGGFNSCLILEGMD